ncbi:MAG: hypothetical protein K9H12_06740 [Bacteroidales bacterium]|nr:hypothetical protein [Bacteroidales bacterium]
MKLFIISLILIFFRFTAYNTKDFNAGLKNDTSQTSDQKTQLSFSKQALQEDFLQMRVTLEQNHTSLYAYTSKEVMDSIMESQYGFIKDSMTLSEFYKILTPVTAKIGCGHTAVWMPGSYWNIDPENLFPLKIKLIEDYVVVTGSYNDTLQVPVGSIIQEINGRLMEDIIQEMRANYSADAFNIHFINSQITRRFSLIYARRFGFPAKYDVKYSLPGRKTSQYKTLIPATNQAVREVVFSNFRHPPLTFKLLEEKNTALLTIPTFIYYDKVPYFTNFIDSCFTIIVKRNIENLILDLRGNDGGDPFCAAPLFSYLQPEPLPYFSEPYGKYSEFSLPLAIPENHYTGNLITLIDGRCFSTNAHFCSLLKYHKIGKFVGTPSGGTYTCNAGKNGIEILKNTGIQLYFGRSSFETAVKNMDKSKPIMPDVYVKESYKDFLQNKDVCFEVALDLIPR